MSVIPNDPCRDRAGSGPPSRTDRNSGLPRETDEIGDDEEVSGEAHVDDHGQLVLKALAVWCCY